MGHLIKYIMVFVMMTSATLSAEQIYRWVDASGQVHYTDDPAAAKKNNANPVDKPAAIKVNSSTTLSDEDRARIEQDRLIQLQLQQKNNERQQALASHCAKLSKDLAFVKNEARQITNGRNADGSLRIMSQRERAQFIAEKEAVYKNTCSNY